MARFMWKNARLAFGQGLWTPYQGEDGKKGSFGAKFIFEKVDLQLPELKKVCVQVAKETWGDKYADVLKSLQAQDRLPYHDGDLKTEWEGFEGMMYISANSKGRPSAFGPDKAAVTEEDGVIYSGCRVNVSLDIWAQDNSGAKGGKRINAGLRGVQFNGPGEAFTGGGSAADESDFDEIAAPAESATDSLLG
jgi:Protein of unknown function (DUF2815)